MKQSSKRLFSMLLALVFLVAAFLVFFDLIQPAYGDLRAMKGKESSSEKLLAEEQKEVAQAKSLISQIAAEDQAAENLALAMPSGPNVAAVLAQVYGIAQVNSIAVQSITISPPLIQVQSQQPQSTVGTASPSQIVKPMGIISVQLGASGSYENVKSFISQLETNIRVFDVTSFSLQAGQASQSGGKPGAGVSGSFNYSVTVATYYQVQ